MSSPTPTTEQIVTLLREGHKEHKNHEGERMGYCVQCRKIWPCPSVEAADALASSPVSPRGATTEIPLQLRQDDARYVASLLEAGAEHLARVRFQRANGSGVSLGEEMFTVAKLCRKAPAASSGGATERGTTFEATPEQIEAAARTMWKRDGFLPHFSTLAESDHDRKRYIADARAVLEAAALAAGCGSQS